MYQECDLMPLKQRVEVTLVKIPYKALSDNRHPLHDTVARYHNRTIYNANTNSWSKKARATFRKLSLGQQPISKELHNVQPPWHKLSFNKIVEESVTKATTSREVLAEKADAQMQGPLRYLEKIQGPLRCIEH